MLSNEQLLNYEQAGFIPAVDVMSADEALVIRRSLEAFEATQGGQLDASQRSRAFLLFKWLDDLIRDPRVLDPIEQLIGPNILCWSTIFGSRKRGRRALLIGTKTTPIGGYQVAM